ncbi:Uncharacterised protein [Nocardiopsis dassonvillei]|uniref:SAV-6107-like HEPN domain-containing protein n=1 Tax=Nocardiopsis dassonvillei (strain ATCC 23218 / DSM 43111 / CIP 107115 / JCM 7437 / KCTC 9190 / NBRC 14626 / NCTC 10488 / NRRL B-5397 / IMRU 509) TaxID=446468 RepID=D7B1R7_NOCDD|nr:conserved hypothetical protein [Nocardiopsis dassonvillei subsp. dassonvillei DSM 43111]VEI89001.1 Uncharacterised protein [Nocardiopsis dassonvillei]
MAMTESAKFLAKADRLLDSLAGPGNGVRRRGAAFLLRMALETGMREYWQRVHPQMARSSTRVQSICLDHQVSASLAGEWSSLLRTLNEACHYHRSALEPSLEELVRWRAGAYRILNDLARASVPR